MTDIRGLMVAIPTPFDGDNRIDFDYVLRHIDFIGERGADGIVVSGTNGEAPSMSLEERSSLIEIAARHKGKLPVVAGTGCTSLAETVALTRAAEESGADAAMVVPPFFFRNASLDGLAQYYTAVLQSTGLPVFLYNIPQLSGVQIRHELIERLLGFGNLAGVKDSSGDVAGTRGYVQTFPQLKVFYGDDRVINEMAGSGVSGGISGIANCLPELIAEAMSVSEPGAGSLMQERVNALTRILDRYPLFAANKFILSLRGFPYSVVRPPLVNLDSYMQSALAAELEEGGYI